MELMESYRRAQDGFDAVLAAVGPDDWDRGSACPEWTVRDVAGHVIWAQEQLRAWATGETYTRMTGAPGMPHPAVHAGDDPLVTWRAARSACTETLTEQNLRRTASLPGAPDLPLPAMITLLVTDSLAHAWDIGYPLGLEPRLDPQLLPASFEWASRNAVRRPGFFGPELTPPADADEQTRWLALLGRRAWQPASA